jgi:hypothetical protein
MISRAATRRASRATLSLCLLAAACSTDEQTGADASIASGGASGVSSSNGGGAGTSAEGSGGSSAVGGAKAEAGGAASGGKAAGNSGAGGAGAPGSDGGSSATGGSDAGAPQGGAAGQENDGGRSFSTDRSRFLGDSRCAAAHVAFCEDFESGSLSAWKLSGTPTIDGVQKARGQKALHVRAASGSKVAIETNKIFPIADNTYYGRAFVYFVALPTPVGSQTYAHWTFIAATGDNVSGEIRVSGQMSNGINHFGVGTDNRTDTNGTGDWTNSDNDPKGAPKTVPLDQWLCIEWMNKGDTNETRFYWDGAEHPSLYTSETMHGGNQNPYLLPMFRRVWLGFQEYQQIRDTQNNLEQYELFIDEVALDHDRIGCVI